MKPKTKLKLPRVLKGLKRAFVRCRAHGRVAFIDYQPHSLSNPVVEYMDCGCDPKREPRIEERVARSLLSRQKPFVKERHPGDGRRDWASREEAETHVVKGTPPRSYLRARDALLGVRGKGERWSFREHVKRTDATHWVTKDGRRIAVRDMEDTHLVNTVRLLRRHAPRARLVECLIELSGPRPSGDGATMAFEHMIEELASMSDDQFLIQHVPPYKRMLERLPKAEADVESRWWAAMDEVLYDPWGDS